MESSGAKENQEGQRRSRSVSNKMDLEFNISNGMGSWWGTSEAQHRL